MMRVLFFRVAAFLAVIASATAADFKVSLDLPSSAAVGEAVRVRIVGDRRFQAKLPELDGAAWRRNSTGSEMRIVNGKTSYALTYVLVPNREGQLEIPPITAKSNNTVAATAPAVLRVLPASSRRVQNTSAGGAGSAASGERSIALDAAVFGRMVPPERTTFYAGEEIPLEFKLYILNSVGVRVQSYPLIAGLDGAIYNDFSQVNPDSRNFAPPRESSDQINGRDYAVLTFSTALRMMKSGEFSPEATVKIGVPQRSGATSDPFFGDFPFFSSTRYEEAVVPFRTAFKITVKPLPPAPADAPYCGLAGTWNFAAKLSAARINVGEVVELTVSGTGNTSAETARAPELNFKNCRIYPPEVRRSGNRVDFKYAVIPLAPGNLELPVRFSYFDAGNGKYRIFSEKLAFEAIPGQVVRPAAVIDSGKAAAAVAQAAKPAAPERADIFYQKPRTSGAAPSIRLPLIDNVRIFLWICGIGGPVTGLLLWLWLGHCDKLAAGGEIVHRRERRRRFAALRTGLRHGADPREILRAEGVPLLADALGLPPGATAEDTAAAVGDVELQELILSLENSGFQPGSGSAEVTPRRIRRFVTRLKKLCLVLLALGAWPLSGSDWNADFDAGDYHKAVAAYMEEIRPGRATERAACNLGGAYYRLGDLPLARLWFERARLLAPSDEEALSDLNVVNRALRLPESGTAGTPLDLVRYCRDRLRPDQYLAAGAAAFALLALLTGAALRRRGAWRWWGAGILSAVFAVSLWSALSQLSGPYSSSRAIVTASTLELRTLPVTAAGRVEAVISGGASAVILEQRGNWVRLAADGREGWAPADAVTRILPSGGFETEPSK